MTPFFLLTTENYVVQVYHNSAILLLMDISIAHSQSLHYEQGKSIDITQLKRMVMSWYFLQGFSLCFLLCFVLFCFCLGGMFFCFIYLGTDIEEMWCFGICNEFGENFISETPYSPENSSFNVFLATSLIISVFVYFLLQSLPTPLPSFHVYSSQGNIHKPSTRNL